MTELTRREQETGAAQIRTWGREHIMPVVKLPAHERDLVILAASLWDLTPGQPQGRPQEILELP